jgi:serine/threonine-protein kinase ULK4
MNTSPPQQALCRITKLSVGIFQNVLDKVGLPKLLAAMVTPVTRIQQAMVTMFLMLINSDVRLTRLIQDKV